MPRSCLTSVRPPSVLAGIYMAPYCSKHFSRAGSLSLHNHPRSGNQSPHFMGRLRFRKAGWLAQAPRGSQSLRPGLYVQPTLPPGPASGPKDNFASPALSGRQVVMDILVRGAYEVDTSQRVCPALGQVGEGGSIPRLRRGPAFQDTVACLWRQSPWE